MIIRPTTLINQLYKYVRHGNGWFLCTLVEMEIFGVSSGILKDGKLVAHSPPVLFIFELRDLSIDSLSETPPTFFRAYQLLMLQCIKCLYTVQIPEGHIYTALDYFPVALLVFIQ